MTEGGAKRNGKQTKRAGTMPRELIVYLLTVVMLWSLSLADPLRFARTPQAASAFSYLYLAHPLIDLFCFIPRFGMMHQETFFTIPGIAWNYPAPCVFVYKFLYAVFPLRHMDRDVFDLYVGSVLLCLLIIAGCFANELRKSGLTIKSSLTYTLTSLVFSWPIYFSLERGNIEGFLWLGIAVSLFFYVRRRWMTTAILLGVIAAFKIYPVLYFGLFLRRRQYWEFGVAAVAMAATTIACLLFVGPTLPIASSRTIEGIRTFLRDYSSSYNPVAIGYDHSGFTLVKVLSA